MVGFTSENIIHTNSKNGCGLLMWIRVCVDGDTYEYGNVKLENRGARMYTNWIYDNDILGCYWKCQ
jgi:hypothetical protein